MKRYVDVSSTEHSGKMKILAKLMKVWARKRFKVNRLRGNHPCVVCLVVVQRCGRGNDSRRELSLSMILCLVVVQRVL